MQNTGKLKYRLDTGQASLALTQGQFELHKLDLDRLIHIDVKHHLSLLTPCHFLIGRFSPLKFFTGTRPFFRKIGIVGQITTEKAVNEK